MTASFNWSDPLLFAAQLTEEERIIGRAQTGIPAF